MNVLTYDRGTLILKTDFLISDLLNIFRFDERINAYRCYAYHYSRVLKIFEKIGLEIEDNVLDPVKCNWSIRKNISLRGYQSEALDAWFKNDCKGIIVLPTGTGKTRIALAILSRLMEPTLIVVPTIELMKQWYNKIQAFFNVSIGFYGGGKKNIRCITIATYDSAYINIEFLGNKFKLIVFDEVHHLPSPGYRQIAEMSAAPYRLGLTATPEREDNLHLDLNTLVGEIVYSRKVSEFPRKYLAEYRIETIRVKLSEEERKLYLENMEKYRRYLEKHNLRLRSIRDFEKIIMKSGLDREAREVILAWHNARKIAFNAVAKIDILKKILSKHRGDRILIFTENNEVVRKISTNLLIPEISYKTDDKEREKILSGFKKGLINIIVTSRVLEEGIDVPDANVAIILSGTGSKREFIQRLGRILRPKDGKQAVLYEIITSGTKEIRISRRRRKI